jgi:hypothetical protein
MTPIWDSELSKYVAEEEKNENETASLEEEINFLREDKPKSDFEKTDNDEVETTTLDDDSDDLPF